MQTSYADACSSIASSPSSLLYLDTCVFLDIVRSPVRDSIDSNSARLAKSLVERSTSAPKSLWLVTSATVELEWEDNINTVFDEVEREIQKLELRRRHFLSAANAATNTQYQHGQIERDLNLANELKVVSKSLLDACLIIAPESTHSLAAMDRVKQYLPPAKRGKAEAKDCEIFELFLGLCRDLRGRGVANNFVFASSNTKDYGPENSGGIQQELTSINAQFTTNLAWANAALNGSA